MSMLCKKLFGKWFKSKSFIRFYSLESGVLDLFPITKSSAIKRPFVDLPEYQDIPSTKNCPGIRKIVSTGWVVLAPADFLIKTTGDGTTMEWMEPWRFTKISEGRESYVSSHGPAQTELLADADTLRTVIKIETPWRVETSDDVVLLQIPVTYNNEQRFYAATGILDAGYGHTINVQLFWKNLNGETLVRAGTPLCQLIPMSRQSINTSSYDVVIEEATELDKKKEREFNYASNCVVLSQDSLASRLTRTLTILNKYKKRG